MDALRRPWGAALIAVAVSSFAPVTAGAAPAATVDGEETDLDGAIEVLEDPDGALALGAVRGDARDWESLDGTTPSFGFVDSAYWFRFALANTRDRPVERLLELAYPPLDDIEVYLIDARGAIDRRAAGDLRPFAEREIAHHNFVFSLTVPASSTLEVYIRVETASSLQVPIRVWAPRAFTQASDRAHLAFGLFYGAMIVMLVYHLFLFAVVRDPSYLYLSLFVAWYSTIQGGLDGLTYQYLWPSYPFLNSFSIPFSIAAGSAAGVQFSRSFLQLHEILPRWDRVQRALVWLGVGLALLSIVVPYAIMVRAATVYAAAAIFVLTSAGIVALRRGFRSARFYVLAWAAFFLGALALILGKFGILPASIPTLHGPQIGATAEIVLLSFALADRINIMKQETALAQGQALEAQRRATETLQEEVDARTVELRERAEQLRVADAQKTRFFQNVSHELRTPLTLILASLDQLASERGLAGDERLELIDKNSRRLLRLVNDLLDFQKLSAGKKQLTPVPIDMSSFLASCAGYVTPVCGTREIAFELVTPDDPVVVEAEADALEKIVFNYLSNALKYTPRGGRIELSLAADDEHLCEIAVSDTGPGIPEDQRDRLFEVFSQLDVEPARESEGSGLGLALVRELAESLGGQVGVDCGEEDEGSRFWVRLPRVSSGVAAATNVQVSGWSGAFESRRAETASLDVVDHEQPSEGPLVLVIDDIADMRTLIRRILHRAGYRTAAASNGADGLERARALHPDAIVSDWMMPELSGPELIAELRADPAVKGIPAILLTAKSDTASRRASARIGADAFVGKPFDEQELLSVVHNLLELKARERELERARRDKEELTRFLVHDLKNPLTVIIATADAVIDTGELDDEDRSALEAIIVAAESTHRMVLDLLDISRSEVGALVAARTDVDLRDLLDEVEDRMGRWLERKHQILQVRCDLDRAALDRGLATRLVENLVVNASKYSPQDAPITVEVSREGADAVLRVRDRGPGIPEPEREAVFDAFHRLRRDRPDSHGGSHGLGLRFCRLAAEAHGGAIGVEDNPGGGSCFWVRLPDAPEPCTRPATGL